MGRVFGILMLVASLWIGLEVYQNGTRDALGGAFAFLGDDSEASPARAATLPQRVGRSVNEDHRLADERRNRLLEE